MQSSYSTSQSRKISELETLQSLISIKKNKDNTWIPAALYDNNNNSYKNVAINLNAITNYCGAYSSYLCSNIEEKLSYYEDNINKIYSYLSYSNIDNSSSNSSYIMSYCSTYTASMIGEAVEKISKNMVTLIDSIKNKPGNSSYLRNNSKKISELTGRDTITKHQDHSWFVLAQYDSRINAYHNIAMNLGTITSYCNDYTSYIMSYNMNVVDLKLRELSDELISYNISYFNDSLSFKYLENGYTPQISLDDIKDLIIDKKLVTLNSNNYTEEAFEHIKQLVFEKDSILFDTSNHLIWTLNTHFGSDVLKKDLLYYSTIKALDIDNTLIDEIVASGPEQILSFKQKDGIKISIVKDDSQDVLELGLDLTKIIRNDFSDKYILYIDENNKIGIKEYKEPIINIKPIDYSYQEYINLPFELESIVPLKTWKTFDVQGYNCEITEVDLENNKIRVHIDQTNYINDINEKIIFNYDDNYTSGKIIIDHIFKTYCYYGCYDTDYIILGKYEISDNSIDSIIDIDQQKKYYAFYRCPKKYHPMFVDNKREMQGDWRKHLDILINDKVYSTYLTQNSGLGNIQWKIVENI